MSTTLEAFTETQLESVILSQITKGTERDQQRLVGPSGIGDCAYCLAVELAKALPEMYRVHDEDSFGFAAWRGTAIHHYIDHSFDIPGALHEQKFEIHEVPGYGLIKGSCDMLVGDTIVDWKALGKYSYDKLSLAYRKSPDRIPTQKYRVQQMLYAYGARKKNYPVERVCIAVIPQFSNTVSDIRFWYEQYNEELALRALERLEVLWGWVQDGDLDDIASQVKPEKPNDVDNCYVCTNRGRTKVDLLTNN